MLYSFKTIKDVWTPALIILQANITFGEIVGLWLAEKPFSVAIIFL